MARYLKLHNGGRAIVDEEDFEFLSQWLWTKDGYGYAIRFYGPRSNQRQLRMHRAILGAREGEIVDHKNMNKLDNRRANLRVCTPSQSNQNRRVRSDSQTRLKGVTLHKSSGLFMSRVRGRLVGYFKNPTEAAKAYNQAAALEFGEFARLNVLNR